MKTLVVLSVLVASISTSVVPKLTEVLDYPDLRTSDERFISDNIISAIEDFKQNIVDAGLDPIEIKREVFSYALPVPILFKVAAFVEDLYSRGLSNIVVNNMNYSVLFSRLNFDIEMPLIHFSVDSSAGEATFFGNTITGRGDGRVDIRNIRVRGEVRVNIGIISGISVSTVRIDFRIGAIETNIRLAIQENNYSEQINKFLSSTVPEVLNEYKSEINELIEIVLKDVINDNL